MAVDGLGDIEDVLLGVKDVDDPDRVGQILVGEVPDPGCAVTEHDAALGAIDAPALKLTPYPLGKG